MIRPQHVLPQPLGKIVAGVGQQHANIAVTGVTTDNRAVIPGDIFIAVPGAHVHGARYADAAARAGAVAIVTDAAGADYISADIPVIVISDVGQKVGEIAARVYDNPADKLTTYAITGTNGKTTTAYMIDHILRALGETTGLIGTVAVHIAGKEIPAELTTPQPADLQAMLAALVEQGGTSLVMEVSSHAIAQGRTNAICFSVAGFTNLTQDHLDFHHSLDEYFATKAQLFTPEHSNKGVVVADQVWGQHIVSAHQERVEALVTDKDQPTAWNLRPGKQQTFSLTSPTGVTISTHTDLPGEFNVTNAALAIAMVKQGGYGLEDIVHALETHDGVSPVVPGRMEIISHAPRVVVDFAHNEDALTQAITALRPQTAGRLIVVTGSAGDRDATKRPAMAKTVAQHADALIITDDDPHSEDPAHIRAELISGIPSHTTWKEIADRTVAITTAITEADQQDTILIAGRGHERFQDIGGTLFELDDREVAREALANRRNDR